MIKKISILLLFSFLFISFQTNTLILEQKSVNLRRARNAVSIGSVVSDDGIAMKVRSKLVGFVEEVTQTLLRMNAVSAEPLEELSDELTLQERHSLFAVATLYGVNSGNKAEDVLIRHPNISKLFSSYIEAKFLGSQSIGGIETSIEEEIGEISETGEAEKLKDLFEVHKSIVNTGFYSPFYQGGPAALLFDGEKFPDSMTKSKLAALIPDTNGSFGIVIFSEHDNMDWHNINSAGGIRVVLASEGFDPLEIWEHDQALAIGMRLKNVLSAIPWAGVKICVVLGPHVTKENEKEYANQKRETLKRILERAVDIGLFTWYVGGPDVNIVADDISESVPVIQQRYLDYLELETRLVDLFVSGQIDGMNIEDLEEGSSYITLENGFKFAMNNSVLKEAYSVYKQKYGGVSSMSELAELAEESEEKKLYLFDENDPAYSYWRGVIDIIEENFNLKFSGQDNLIFSAMRERAIEQFRDSETDFDMSERQFKDDLHRIMGVLVGGGPAEMGTFARAEALDGITGQLTVRGLNRVVEHLGLSETDEKLSIIIRGAGDVGTAAALRAIEYGYKVVGISNKYSAVYAEDGFTKEQIQKLRQATNKDKNISLVFSKNMEGIQLFDNPDKILEENADFLVPCAIGPTVTEENIGIFKHFKAIVAGENHPYLNDKVVEDLHDSGIMATRGWLVNFGMVYAVWREALLKHRYTVEELRDPVIWESTLEDIREEGNNIIDEMLPLVLRLSEKQGISPNFIAEGIVRAIEDEMTRIYSDENGEYESEINEIILKLREEGYKMTYTQARRLAAYQLSREKVLEEYRNRIEE